MVEWGFIFFLFFFFFVGLVPRFSLLGFAMCSLAWAFDFFMGSRTLVQLV